VGGAGPTSKNKEDAFLASEAEMERVGLMGAAMYLSEAVDEIREKLVKTVESSFVVTGDRRQASFPFSDN